MAFWWSQLRGGFTLIAHGDSYVIGLLWVTVRVALISTAAAVLIGLPLGVGLGIGRFRGRRALQVLAGIGLGLPPVVVGVVVLLCLVPEGPLASLHLAFTIRAVYVAQTILALPYVIALTPAAIQALPPGLLGQARALGATRRQLARLALREARVGILAAVIAALGAAVSEVGAVAIVGGNTMGQTETLASGLISEFTYQPNDPYETAIAMLLAALVVVLLGGLALLQRTGARPGALWRFRASIADVRGSRP